MEVTVEKVPIETMPGLWCIRLAAKCKDCGEPYIFFGPMEGDPTAGPIVNPQAEGRMIECPAIVKGTPPPRVMSVRGPTSVN
jgi:hypothetical protein